MKQIKITATLILAFALALPSCDSFFDVQLDDQATLEEIFSKSTTCRQYLAHLYSYIPLDEEIVGSHGWVVPRSDEAQYSWYQWVYYTQFKTGNYSSATTDFNYWKDFYIGINQCSIFLDNIDLNTEDSEATITQWKAEARFLRAFYYFCLFRQYGPVFLWFDETPDENIPPASIDRHTVEQNVEFIVSELEKAAEDLPTSHGSASGQYGHVTKGAALALKSRLLLYAASPLYNGASIYIGQMRNIRGEYLFPQTHDPNKWEVAAEAAKDVIDMNLYSLYEDTSETDPFRKAAASYKGVMTEPWNVETIWGWWWRTSSAYNYLGTVGGTFGPGLPSNFGLYDGYGGSAPSLKLVDSYPMAATGRYPVTGYQGINDLSRPIVDSRSGYVESGFTESYTQPLVDDWADPIKAHNSCIGRDARFYASVVPNGFYWQNRTMNKLFTCYNSTQATSPWNAASGCIRVGYAWVRLLKPDTPLATQADFLAVKYVYPAFRMAEIYLNYAEACNEKPRRDEATALEYLNKVRRRAGLNDIEQAYPEIRGDQELLRWCIQKEKMVEFGMEAMRYYDACRWMIAKDEYPGENWTLWASATNYEDSYERVSTDFVGAPNIFRDKDYLYPINAKQLAEMTSMTQNYGH